MRPARRAWWALLPLWAALPALMHAQQLVPARSEVVFVSRQMGVPVEGRFRSVEAQLAFDPQRPESAAITLSIDLASVELGTAEIEAELAKLEWFDSRRTPKAVFRSRSVRATGPGRYEMAGPLTIKGTTRDVLVPVSLAAQGELTTASGEFVLKRLDYRIGAGDWNDTSLVADEVRVRFRLALTGLAVPR